MRQFLDSMTTTAWLLAGGLGLALFLAIFVWWLVAGPGPRRQRGVRRGPVRCEAWLRTRGVLPKAE